jgi:hypothetical protein
MTFLFYPTISLIKGNGGEACPDIDNLIQLVELHQISLDNLIRGGEGKEAAPEEPVTPPAPAGDCEEAKQFSTSFPLKTPFIHPN